MALASSIDAGLLRGSPPFQSRPIPFFSILVRTPMAGRVAELHQP